MTSEQILAAEMGAEWREWKEIVLDNVALDWEERETVILDKWFSLDNECYCTNEPIACPVCRTQRRESQTGYNVITPADMPGEVLPF